MINQYLLSTTSPCINRYFNDLGNLLFFIILIILSLVVIKSLQLKYENKNFKNKIIFFNIKFSSFESKIIYFIFFYHVIFTLINVFFADCDEMTSSFPVVPNDANSIYINAGYWFHETRLTLGSNVLSHILYPLVSILKISFLNINLLFSLLGFFGILYFYFLTKKKIYDLNLNLYFFLIILIILPNFHYWTSYLTKESVIFSFLSLYLFYIFTNEENSKFKLFLVLFFLVCFAIRPYFGLFFFVSHLAALFFIRFKNNGLNFNLLALFLAVNIIAYIIFVVVYWKFDYTGIFDIPSNIVYFLDQRFRVTMVGSSFDKHHGYILQFLFYFFSPLEFPSDFNPRGLIIFFNNFILLSIFMILILHMIFNYKFLQEAISLTFEHKTKKILRIGLLFFLIFFIFILSNSTANYGIIMRQKETIMFAVYFYLIYINSNILLIKNK